MKSFFCILLTLFISFGSQSLIYGEKCPAPGPPPRHFIDLNKYFGTWYLQWTGTPKITSNPGGPECTSHTYTGYAENPYLFNVFVSEKSEGVLNNRSGIATVENLVIPSHYDMYIDNTYYPIDIVATDFDQYSILYMCYDNSGRENATIVWSVMSRERSSVNPTLEKAIINYLEGLGIQSDELFPINQVGC